MKDFLETDHLIEERLYINGEIPLIRFRLRDKEGRLPTIILYHGWSSSKESQRLRGFILANLGFQVLIPDATNHGERKALVNYDSENSIKYFWPTIIRNIEESKEIIDYAVDNLAADKDRIGVIGHSMGGFTAAGVFTHHHEVKTAVILNGSYNWQGANEIFLEALGVESTSDFQEEEKIDSLDPMNNLDLIINRPTLLLHGFNDQVVKIDSQRVFYEKIRPLYSDQSSIQLIEYINLGHFVTTNMMEEAAIWFKKYL